MPRISDEVDFIVRAHLIDPRLKEDGKRRRNRLTGEEGKVLNIEFQKNPDWNRQK